MTPEKASTLRLLRAGIGRTVNVLETKSAASYHEVKAHLPDCTEGTIFPILFLLSSLAFLEALSEPDFDGSDSPDFNEVDGWTPADFLSHICFEDRFLRITLKSIRGRAVNTEMTLSAAGDLVIRTQGRGQSATRWLSYVQGRTHLTEVQ